MDSIPVQAAELKPMTLSELLDRTFTLYRNRFWLFCGLMVGPEIAILLCSLIVIVAFPIRDLPVATANPQNPFAALASLESRLAATFVAAFVQALFGALALGAVTVAVSELYLGRAATIRGSYEAVRGRIFGLFGLILMLMLVGIAFLTAGSFAGGFAGAIGMIASSLISPVIGVIFLFLFIFAGVIGAVWLLMRFAVSIPAFMLERRGVVESMSRSGALTQGHRNRIFATVIVMYIVLLVFQVALAMPFLILQSTYRVRGLFPLWIQIGQAASAAVASTIAAPLVMIAIALIYYDVRIRKEAFDLESMMGAMNSSTDAGGNAGVPPPLQPAS
jgi:MFS family permease